MGGGTTDTVSNVAHAPSRCPSSPRSCRPSRRVSRSSIAGRSMPSTPALPLHAADLLHRSFFLLIKYVCPRGTATLAGEEGSRLVARERVGAEGDVCSSAVGGAANAALVQARPSAPNFFLPASPTFYHSAMMASDVLEASDIVRAPAN